MNYLFIVLLSAALVSQSYTMGLSVYAQNNSASNQTSVQNQTAATLTGQPESVLLNKTTIPAEQTTVTVNQSTEQIEGQADLQPIGNQTLVEQTPQLSELENETMVESTGPAVTTVVNKTVVPFNQTMLETGQVEELQQQQQTTNQSSQNQTSQQPPSQQQQNQSSQNQGPLEQIGESLGNLVGG